MKLTSQVYTKNIETTDVTNGSEKQNSWANNLKVQSIVTVDSLIANLINHKGAVPEKGKAMFDTIYNNINAMTDARQVIDSLKDISGDPSKLAAKFAK